MIYRVALSETALRKLDGFPLVARDALVVALARITEGPYDLVHSTPIGGDPRHRWAMFGDAGFVELSVDDSAVAVTVEDLAWAG